MGTEREEKYLKVDDKLIETMKLLYYRINKDRTMIVLTYYLLGVIMGIIIGVGMHGKYFI